MSYYHPYNDHKDESGIYVEGTKVLAVINKTMYSKFEELNFMHLSGLTKQFYWPTINICHSFLWTF